MKLTHISEEVTTRRNRLQLTQKELAGRSNGLLTRDTIAKVESGKSTNITIETLLGLGVAFDCPAVDLLPDEFKRPPTAQKAA